MKNLQGAIVIGIMCFLLSLGIAVQISSINKESTVIAKENTENELRDKVLELTEDYNKKYKKLDKLEKQLEKLREKASKSSEQSETWSKNLEKVNNSLGLTKVNGKGIIIQIKSGDLLLVLNALNNAGAEAISVNDNRITFLSDISTDGDVVSLDGKVLESPYVIKAIGGSALYGAITMPGSYIDNLKKIDGYDVSIDKSEDITINKFSGIYNFNFASNYDN